MVYCTNIQGSALYDATLGDKDLIEEQYQAAVKKQSKKIVDRAEEIESEWRPPRRGYSREVEALYDVVDNLVALRGEMGRWNATATVRQMSKRPWFPSEVVETRMRYRARTIRDSRIRESQQRHAERHGRRLA